MGLVRRQVEMVNPNVLGCLDGDGISSTCNNLGYLQVANDNIFLLVDAQSNAVQCGTRVLSENSLVATNFDRFAAADHTIDDDDFCGVIAGSGFECGKRRDSYGRSSSSTFGSSIERSISDSCNFGSGCTAQENCGRRSLNGYEPEKSSSKLHIRYDLEEVKKDGKVSGKADEGR